MKTKTVLVWAERAAYIITTDGEIYHNKHVVLIDRDNATAVVQDQGLPNNTKTGPRRT